MVILLEMISLLLYHVEKRVTRRDSTARLTFPLQRSSPS